MAYWVATCNLVFEPDRMSKCSKHRFHLKSPTLKYSLYAHDTAILFTENHFGLQLLIMDFFIKYST